MTRTAAALLLRTRDDAAREAVRRRVNAAELLARLSSARRGGAISIPKAGTAGYLRFPLRVRGGLAGLSDPRRALTLGAAPGYPSILAALSALHPRLVNREDRWPGAEALVRDLMTFPTHSRLTPTERAALGKLLES
jgi:dTDP-4-amino-4,6-dideoxygalactose transaminase